MERSQLEGLCVQSTLPPRQHKQPPALRRQSPSIFPPASCKSCQALADMGTIKAEGDVESGSPTGTWNTDVGDVVDGNAVRNEDFVAGNSLLVKLQRVAGKYGMEQRGIERVSDDERDDTSVLRVGIMVRESLQREGSNYRELAPGNGKLLTLHDSAVVLMQHGRDNLRHGRRGHSRLWAWFCRQCTRHPPSQPCRSPARRPLQRVWCQVWTAPDGPFAFLLWVLYGQATWVMIPALLPHHSSQEGGWWLT